MVSSHSMAVLEQSLRRQDKIESELTKQIHNGRLFRLLAKLGFINERPKYVNYSAHCRMSWYECHVLLVSAWIQTGLRLETSICLNCFVTTSFIRYCHQDCHGSTFLMSSSLLIRWVLHTYSLPLQGLNLATGGRYEYRGGVPLIHWYTVSLSGLICRH